MTDDHHPPAMDESSADDDSGVRASGSDAGRTQNTRKIRWWVPVLTLIVAAGASIGAWNWAGDNLSLRPIAGAVPWFITLPFLLFWWLCLSGARWRTRFLGLGVVFGCLILFVAIFRWEGQAGNFVPQFRLRFLQTAENRAIEYFDSQDAAADSVSAFPDRLLEVTGDDWPRFGGASTDHIVTESSIRRDWDENPPTALWRHPVGLGWSSFAIVGDYAFTQEQRGDDEAVVCYDVHTGKQLWLHTDRTRFEEPASGPGPRATPTVFDSRLYTLGATGILNCLDAVTGKSYWSTNIVEDAGTPLIEWGMAGSPLIYKDVVIVNPGGETGAVAAYDRITGAKQWAGAGDRAGYASPQVAELDGVVQILIYCSTGLCGHDINSGHKLWSFPWTNMTKLNIAQPIVLPDTSVFISSGYGGGSALLDVNLKDDSWQVKPRWTARNRFRLKFNGGIYRDGYVYGLDEGILSCFDLSIGKRTWKRGRYKFGQILMVGDDLLVSTESGRVVLLEVTPKEPHKVASFQAIEGKTWNHPVVNRGRLFIRNGAEAACYDLRPHPQ